MIALIYYLPSITEKIEEIKERPEFKYQAGFFGVGIVATGIIAGTGTLL